MTAGMIIGLVLLPLAWMILAAINKTHREETGVPMPSRGAMKNIRRNARKKGISEAEAYSLWLARKQKRAGISLFSSHTVHVIQPQGINPSAQPKILSVPPPRIRPEPHEPFDFDHLSMIAATYGWTLRKQAGGLYYLIDKNKKTVENPYADEKAIKTDFNHRDLEDFLLTC